MMQAIPVQCHRKLVMQLFSGLTKSNASVRAWKTTCLCSAVRFGDRPNFLCMLTFFFCDKTEIVWSPVTIYNASCKNDVIVLV